LRLARAKGTDRMSQRAINTKQLIDFGIVCGGYRQCRSFVDQNKVLASLGLSTGEGKSMRRILASSDCKRGTDICVRLEYQESIAFSAR
jgi:hypothetical protein